MGNVYIRKFFKKLTNSKINNDVFKVADPDNRITTAQFFVTSG